MNHPILQLQDGTGTDSSLAIPATEEKKVGIIKANPVIYFLLKKWEANVLSQLS